MIFLSNELSREMISLRGVVCYVYSKSVFRNDICIPTVDLWRVWYWQYSNAMNFYNIVLGFICRLSYKARLSYDMSLIAKDGCTFGLKYSWRVTLFLFFYWGSPLYAIYMKSPWNQFPTHINIIFLLQIAKITLYLIIEWRLTIPFVLALVCFKELSALNQLYWFTSYTSYTTSLRKNKSETLIFCKKLPTCSH